jgi:hypothetical protein
MLMLVVLVSITLAMIALLVKVGAIKKSTQEKTTGWIFGSIIWLFRGAISLLVRWKIISPYQGERFYAKTVNSCLENLPYSFIIIATIITTAIVFGVIYLTQGGLPEISNLDWRAVGIDLPIYYKLSRWFDLFCLGVWMLVNLSAYRFIRRTSVILFVRFELRLFWRIFRNYYLLIFGASCGLAAVVILEGAIYGLLINILLWLIFWLLTLIGRGTIRFSTLFLASIFEGPKKN